MAKDNSQNFRCVGKTLADNFMERYYAERE